MKILIIYTMLFSLFSCASSITSSMPPRNPASLNADMQIPDMIYCHSFNNYYEVIYTLGKGEYELRSVTGSKMTNGVYVVRSYYQIYNRAMKDSVTATFQENNTILKMQYKDSLDQKINIKNFKVGNMNNGLLYLEDQGQLAGTVHVPPYDECVGIY